MATNCIKFCTTGEAGTLIEPLGTYTWIYLTEDTDDPIEVRVAFDDMIDSIYEMHTIPGTPIITKDGVTEINEITRGLREFADKLEKSLEAYQVKE
jgi:hypothetical protein